MDTNERIRAAAALLAREEAQAAFALLAPALAGAPDDVALLAAMAEVLAELDRPADATAAYRKILALDPGHAGAREKLREATAAMEMLLRLAFIADEARAWDEARENYEAVLYQEPRAVLALTRLLALDGAEGRLADAERHHRALIAALGETDLMAVPPTTLAMIAYQAIMRPLPPDLLDDVTAALRRQVMAQAEAFGPLPAPLAPSAARLRIGYLSNNLRDHPIGHVTAALFAAHDRAKFDVHVFSWPAGGPNPYTAQIKAGAEHFHEARDAEGMLRAIARQNLDLLVYLDGYMSPFLLPLIARRPAPVQVYWLGHAGGCEAPGIDGFIADALVVPPGEERLYRAEVARLPIYHPASPHAVGAEVSRAEAGLPEEGFVFCAFNAPEKIDTPTFALWMRILRRVPGSCLWLSRGQSAALATNLRREAEAQGVDGARLIFAERLADKAAHLARHRHAGLFLDTLGLNASTTALDALWAGLPVLTVRGGRFASRIAAAFLTCLDLPELICRDAADFEERAVALAADPERSAGARARLAERIKDRPLFQIADFCRTLESALITLHATHKRT